MKNYIGALITIALFSLPSGPVNAETYSANHERVARHFSSNKEKTAKDSIWTARDIFKIGVLSDGTSRDGYAQYACQVIYDYGFKGKRVWVQIIDIAKLVQNDEWVTLGEAHCK